MVDRALRSGYSFSHGDRHRSLLAQKSVAIFIQAGGRNMDSLEKRAQLYAEQNELRISEALFLVEEPLPEVQIPPATNFMRYDFFAGPQMKRINRIELRPQGTLQAFGKYSHPLRMILFCFATLGVTLLLGYKGLLTGYLFLAAVGLGIYMCTSALRANYRNDRIVITEDRLIRLQQGKFGTRSQIFQRSEMSQVKIVKYVDDLGTRGKLSFLIYLSFRENTNRVNELFIYRASRVEVARGVADRLSKHLGIPVSSTLSGSLSLSFITSCII